MHIKHDTEGKLLFTPITDYTWYVLGATYVSNNALHIRLDCCCMMSYVNQMTPCYQVTTKMGTDSIIANTTPCQVNTLGYMISIIASTTLCYVNILGYFCVTYQKNVERKCTQLWQKGKFTYV